MTLPLKPHSLEHGTPVRFRQRNGIWCWGVTYQTPAWYKSHGWVVLVRGSWGLHEGGNEADEIPIPHLLKELFPFDPKEPNDAS